MVIRFGPKKDVPQAKPVEEKAKTEANEAVKSQKKSNSKRKAASKPDGETLL